MVVYLTEKEMIDRYADGLQESASRALEFTTSAIKERPKLFTQFIHGIKVAAGSAHQLAHAQMNPKWLDVRDLLEKIIDMNSNLPITTFNSEQQLVWSSISKSLLSLVEKGKTLATMKVMPHYEVLSRLDVRQKKLEKELNANTD